MELLSTSPLITIFGGSGFVGAILVESFASLGWRVRVVTRDPSRAMYLKPLGDLGQIGIARGDVRQPDSVRAAVENAQAVVNLVGILDEGEQKFDDIARGAGTVAAAAALAGVRSFVHVSAIGADDNGKTAYQRSKAQAESLVQQVLPGAAIVRPALIFGPGDKFTNQIGQMAGMSKCVPVICPDSKLQPVYVRDVAAAIVAVVKRHLTGKTGGIWELAGPETMTMAEVTGKVVSELGIERRQPRMSSFMASLMSRLPGVPFTRSQLALLAQDNLPSSNHPGLAELGIQPTNFDAVAGEWLGYNRPGGRFAAA